MRLINKETLCGLLADKSLEAQLEDECTELAIKECLSIVRRMPEAVVRCRECKHLGFCGDATNLEVMGFYGYCSRGERKEGADNDT